MPAFGQNGIVNINQSAERQVWRIKDPEGKVLMVCENEAQAEMHRQSLSQKLNKECSVERGKMACL